MKIHRWIIILFLFIGENLFAQKRNMPPSREAGKCYAKCLITNGVEIEEYEVAYPIYIGDRPDSVEIETITIILNKGKATTKWVQKRAAKDCISSNPDDCLVWCLVEDRPEPMVLEIEILADTFQTQDFIYEYFLFEEEITELEKKTEWREVICNPNITPTFISTLQEKLKEEGFYRGNPTKFYTTELKIALLNFQKENDLPYGQIDLETLKELGIFLETSD